MAFITIHIPDELYNLRMMAAREPNRRKHQGFIQADAIIEVTPVPESWATKYQMGYRSQIVFEHCGKSHNTDVADTPEELLQRCLDAGLVG